MKKKQFYEKPSVKVFELKQQQQLLAGSAGLDDYQWNTPDEE
jgi:hypothetical protein